MKAIQTFFAEAGESACYGFMLGDVADEFDEERCRKIGGVHDPIDPCQSLLLGVERKRIHYNWDDENDENNFFVDFPEAFLEDLTGVRWEVRKEAPDYQPKPGEYIIKRSERTSTGKVLGHFWRDRCNSLRRSLCVERGTVVSLRVCRPL